MARWVGFRRNDRPAARPVAGLWHHFQQTLQNKATRRWVGGKDRRVALQDWRETGGACGRIGAVGDLTRATLGGPVPLHLSPGPSQTQPGAPLAISRTEGSGSSLVTRSPAMPPVSGSACRLIRKPPPRPARRRSTGRISDRISSVKWPGVRGAWQNAEGAAGAMVVGERGLCHRQSQHCFGVAWHHGVIVIETEYYPAPRPARAEIARLCCAAGVDQHPARRADPFSQCRCDRRGGAIVDHPPGGTGRPAPRPQPDAPAPAGCGWG